MDYSYYDTGNGFVGAFSTAYMLVLIAIVVVCIIAQWKMFEKAGVEGWKSLIPFYNSYCLCEIAMGNGLLFLLSFVPCVNFIFSIVLCLNVAKAYGKDTLFGILTIFFTPIMYLILAFSDAEYIGPQK
jgi:hypothetical protein